MNVERRQMQGYRRSEQVTDQLVAALTAALRNHPEQRLGQLIINIAPFTARHEIWNTHDEEWLALLTEEN